MDRIYLIPERVGLAGKNPITNRERPRSCSRTAAIVHVASLPQLKEEREEEDEDDDDILLLRE